MGGANKLLQIELKAELVNGNSRRNTPVLVYEFKTQTSKKKFVRFRRTKAIDMLVSFLLDKNLCSKKELAWILIKYDWEDAGKKTFLDSIRER